MTMTFSNKLLSIIAAVCAATLASGVHANPFEGLYQPKGANWDCTMQTLGSDGGAIGIVNGKLEGVENSCTLNNAKKTPSGGTQYTTTCQGEGMTETGTVVLTKTASGLIFSRNGYAFEWESCAANPAVANTPARWSYDGTKAAITHNGMSFEMACMPVTASSTSPTAVFKGHCPTCSIDQEVTFTFQIDTRFTEFYVFNNDGPDVGYFSDLGVSREWNGGLVAALIAGNRFKIFDNQTLIAEFPLAGSSKALKSLRTDCN